MQESAAPTRAKLAPAAVRLAALWVLGVTSIKLFKGSPNDLPLIIRDHFFSPELNFNLSIAIELSCAFFALLYPRRGFAPLAALMVVFVGVLVYLISSGASSCGCFGGAIKFPPWAMLAVDGSLLAAMLATRPWASAAASKPPLLLIGGATAVAWAAPWLLIDTYVPPVPPVVVADANGTPPAQWRLPDPLPRFTNLRPGLWPDHPVHEIELATWIDTSALPSDDNHWVIYLASCEHCRDFLRKLYAENPVDPSLVLVEWDDGRPRQVDLVPETPWKASLPNIAYVFTPPWELVLQGGIVKSATFRGEE